MRKLSLYQIELTAFCDMKCSYCPHPGMEREKGHMSEETLAKCIEHAKRAGQERLVLHHFGEPLLHPKLKERLDQVAASGMQIQFSTNGLLLEKKWPILLEVKSKISITLSMHQWSDQKPGVYFEAFKEWQKRAEGTNITMLKAFNVTEKSEKYHLHKWTKSEDSTPWDFHTHCFFLRDNWGVVTWNGDIVSCCADAEGESVIGNVFDENAFELQTKSWHGCDTCDLFGKPHKQKAKEIRDSFMEKEEKPAPLIPGLKINWANKNN